MVRSPIKPISHCISFPLTIADANKRYEECRSVDPYPEISPALLNSADITDYARQSGLIYKFDERKLKPASYGVRVGAKIVFWDGTGELDSKVDIPVKLLREGEEFRIPKNSLVFVQTEEVFLLPYYIAARFNLQISLVHKGLLLGTGPLVDPGFRGPLMVPLHNLTENDYALCRGDDLIWVEFTKLSTNPSWDREAERLRTGYHLAGSYVPFVEKVSIGGASPIWPESEDYIKRALQAENPKLAPHRSIRNAIPKEIYGLTRRVEAVEKWLKRFGWGAFAGIVFAMAAIVFGFVEPLLDVTRSSESASALSKQVRDEFRAALPQIQAGAASATRVQALEQRVNDLEARIPPPRRNGR